MFVICLLLFNVYKSNKPNLNIFQVPHGRFIVSLDHRGAF